MTDWLLRPYDPIGDEGFVVESWLHSHGGEWDATEHRWRGGSEYARSLRKAFGGGAYWTAHRPVVLSLLRRANVSVLCIPDTPAVILGWVATGGEDVLHYALCKRSIHKAGLADDAYRQMLGDRLRRKQLVTHDQSDLRDTRLWPRLASGARAPQFRHDWVPAPYALAERAA